MTAKEYYKSTRMVETTNWTLEMALNFAEEYAKVLHQSAVMKSVCEHDVRNFKDRQECEKCGEVWIRQKS